MARGRGSVSVSVEIALDQAVASREKMRSSAFQRLMATKINEEMATQLPAHLTAHEFLACGYGHDLGKYACVVGNPSLIPLPLDSARRHRLPSSPRKRIAKYGTCSTTTLPRHKAGWDWSKARVHVWITGKVQGVHYLTWAWEQAKHMTINGWIRDVKDGSVEAVFSGKPVSVDQMLDLCKTGPSYAKVEEIQAKACDQPPGAGFQQLPPHDPTKGAGTSKERIGKPRPSRRESSKFLLKKIGQPIPTIGNK